MFLSHTSDLSELPAGHSFVAAATQAVIEAGDGLVEMESFGPSDSAPSVTSASKVAWADIYVGIIGLRYGSPVPESPELSYTELEFETAGRLQMERLIFLLDERSEDVPRPVGPANFDERQLAFRGRLLDMDATVATVATPEELARRLLRALYDLPDRAAIPNELGPRGLAAARRYLLHQVGNLVREQERSTDQLLRIELGLAERPSAAYRPHVRRILRRRSEADRPLPRDRPIDDLFREFGGQLLILGEPGAGKTSLLLQLAGRLAETAARDPFERMPVVLHLATWAEGRSLAFDRWLADEMKNTYGVSTTLTDHWMAEGLLVPMLDGLDEVDPARRDACIEAINAFCRERGQASLVVCSRTVEFDALRTRLHLAAAVVILPLERQEAELYLRAAGPPLDRLPAALQRDDALWELLTTPLFLNVVAVAYRNRSMEEIGQGASIDDLRAKVLSVYVERMLERLEASPEVGQCRADVLSRLRWLAGAMTAHAQSVLYLDLLQPDWLTTVAQRRAVTYGVSGAVGVLAGLLVAAVLAVDTVSPHTPGLGPAYVLLAAPVLAIFSYRTAIEPTMELGWSWRALRNSFPTLFGSSLVVAAGLGLTFGVAAALARQLGVDAVLAPTVRPPPLVEGLTVLAQVVGGCVVAGLIAALTAGINERYAIDPPGPGRALRATRRSWLVSTLVLGLPAAGVFLIAIGLLRAPGDPVARERPRPAAVRGGKPRTPVAGRRRLAGLAGGPLVSGILPATRRPRPGRGLRVGVAAAAIMAPAQFVIAHSLIALGVHVESTYVPGVQDWVFAAGAAGLIAAVGGSPRSGVVYGLIVATAAGPIVARGGPGVLHPDPILVALSVVIVLGSGLRRGGGAFLRHWTLRWWLAHDRLLPLDAVPFLELATQLGLLRRRGGGYQFFHRLLQEHLARQPDAAG